MGQTYSLNMDARVLRIIASSHYAHCNFCKSETTRRTPIWRRPMQWMCFREPNSIRAGCLKSIALSLETFSEIHYPTRNTPFSCVPAPYSPQLFCEIAHSCSGVHRILKNKRWWLIWRALYVFKPLKFQKRTDKISLELIPSFARLLPYMHLTWLSKSLKILCAECFNLLCIWDV